MIGIPLQSEQFLNGVKVGGSRLEYTFSGNTLTAGTFYQTVVARPYQAYSLNKDSTWQLQTTVEEYVNGLPTKIRKPNFLFPQVYTWDAYRRVTNKNFGTLNTAVGYYGTSNLPNLMTDENGLRTKFTYDSLMRLSRTQNRFTGTDINNPQNVQATTLYNYHYKGQPATNASDVNQNFVGTITTFKGVTPPLSTKQYMDGLGRPIGGIKEYYTPSNLHQKNFVSYDALGRQDRAYQPFESATLGFEALDAASTTVKHVETKYEASPLSRPIEQKNVDGTSVFTSYGANTAADAVRLFEAGATANTVIACTESLTKDKPSTAVNYFYDSQYTPTIAFNLVPNSDWSSDNQPRSLITYDFGAAVPIRQVKFNILQFQNVGATATHEVFYSTDNATWTSLDNFGGVANAQSTVKDYTVNAIQARYFRVRTTASASFAAWSSIDVATNANYTEGSLYKTVMTDENVHNTEVYKDKLGRVLLTRKFLGTERVDTYNVYDDYGNLAMVIPPSACNGTTIEADLVFKYTYDNENRLSTKKVPGADVVNFYYDDRDLLTLTQDGNMRAQNKYLATKYDDLGRVEATGFLTNVANPTATALNVTIPQADALTTIVDETRKLSAHWLDIGITEMDLLDVETKISLFTQQGPKSKMLQTDKKKAVKKRAVILDSTYTKKQITDVAAAYVGVDDEFYADILSALGVKERTTAATQIKVTLKSATTQAPLMHQTARIMGTDMALESDKKGGIVFKFSKSGLKTIEVPLPNGEFKTIKDVEVKNHRTTRLEIFI